MQSMHRFPEEKKASWGLRMSLENFSSYGQIRVIPLYALSNLLKQIPPPVRANPIAFKLLSVCDPAELNDFFTTSSHWSGIACCLAESLFAKEKKVPVATQKVSECNPYLSNCLKTMLQ